MNYKIYTCISYDGKYRFGVDFNYNYYTNIKRLGYAFVIKGLINDVEDFKKNIRLYTKSSTLSFNNKKNMNEARDYIESLLIMAKLTEE